LRGFRNWINSKGQDPRLPDAVLDRFTNEQLFFLGYAQQYCPSTDLNWYAFGAKQSSNEFRLLGTLSNSQIFRSAYNCLDGEFV
jgi:predicted metalloendopeptidase